MKKFSFFLLISLLIVCASFLSSCQEVPGCTDPLSLNYNPEANSDDGSCSYERDAFLGSYTGTSVCSFSGFWNSDNFQFTIRADEDDPTIVRVAFPFNMSTKPVTFFAEVDGNTLTFGEPTNEPDNLPLCGVDIPVIIVTGTATLTGTRFLFEDFEFHVVGDSNQRLCPVECVIDAEKDS